VIPVMVRGCTKMANSWELDANTIDFDDLKAGMEDQRFVQCNGCNSYFVWDKIPDCCIQKYREHHGEPNLTPEIVITGWECPSCGYHVDF